MMTNKFDLTGSVLTVKKPKKKYNEDDTSTLLTLDSVIETLELFLQKRRKRSQQHFQGRSVD